MDIIEEIKKIEDEKELRKKVRSLIRKATRHSKKINGITEFIGTETDINPNFKIKTNEEQIGDLSVRDCYAGYIPKGTKIVYGTTFDMVNEVYANEGYYYYLDDDEYIFEFFKFIQDYEIEEDYDLLVAIFDFINDYFGCLLNPKTREEMHQLILKSEDYYYRPTKEHSIKDFKSNGSAVCTEYSVVAQNILSLLGFDVVYMMDVTHAYNLFANGKDEIYILDYAQPICVYDLDFNVVGVHPYFEQIPDMDEDKLEEFLRTGDDIEIPDYYLQDINDTLFTFYNDEKRKYGLSGVMDEKEESLVRKRKF